MAPRLVDWTWAEGTPVPSEAGSWHLKPGAGSTSKVVRQGVPERRPGGPAGAIGPRTGEGFMTRTPGAEAIALLALLGGLGCGERPPARNATSDLATFSRVPEAWALSRGAGATVAVLDWQFDPAAEVAAHYVAPTSLVPGERIGGLDPWHGAEMVRIVRHVAPEAGIMPIIARASGRAYQDQVIEGIRYAADHGAVAVTNSMGLVTASPALRAAIDYAEERGTLFVDVHPENTVAVPDSFVGCQAGACDARIVHAGIVAVPEHPLRPNSARDVYTWPYDLTSLFRDGWGYSSGPPVIAGVIALMKAANPALAPADIRRILVATAAERDGFRVLDAAAAVAAARAQEGQLAARPSLP